MLALICDAPAKAFVLCTKSRTGFSSCSKCIIEGNRYNNRICFPPSENIDVPLRTDAEFRSNVYGDYHNNATILQEIPHFDLIQNVPLDYMHLVCLGVVKKLIGLWIEFGPRPTRLRPRYVRNISDMLKNIQKTTPIDFGRKPRAMSEYRQWKATEFRTFLLYTGPVVLQHYLKKNIYEHFLSLHIAMSILISPIMSKISSYVDYAEALLKHFVSTFECLYGKCFISHNIHNLVHLCNDVKKYGPLDSFSAFRFDNFLSSIKRQLRKSDKPLQQLWKRYMEIQLNSDDGLNMQEASVLSKKHCDGPIINSLNIVEQYKVYNGSTFSIQCNRENDRFCFLIDGSCIYVENIIKTIDNKTFVLGRLLSSLGSLYTSPCDSEQLSIRIVSPRFCSIIDFWPISEIIYKAWALPSGNLLIVTPILHSLNIISDF